MCRYEITQLLKFFRRFSIFLTLCALFFYNRKFVIFIGVVVQGQEEAMVETN